MLVGHAQMLVVAAGHAAVPSPSLALPSAPVLVLVLVLDDPTTFQSTAGWNAGVWGRVAGR